MLAPLRWGSARASPRALRWVSWSMPTYKLIALPEDETASRLACPDCWCSGACGALDCYVGNVADVVSCGGTWGNSACPAEAGNGACASGGGTRSGPPVWDSPGDPDSEQSDGAHDRSYQ